MKYKDIIQNLMPKFIVEWDKIGQKLTLILKDSSDLWGIKIIQPIVFKVDDTLIEKITIIPLIKDAVKSVMRDFIELTEKK